MSEPFDPFEASAPEIFEVKTRAPGPAGKLPLTEEMLREHPSGDLFGLTQNAGMGWTAAEVAGKQFLILSTQGGLRAPDGTPIVGGTRYSNLSLNTGHGTLGWTQSAGSGKVLADLICGIKPEISIEGLSLQRYAGRGQNWVVPFSPVAQTTL